jgi:uncharacterized protein
MMYSVIIALICLGALSPQSRYSIRGNCGLPEPVWDAAENGNAAVMEKALKNGMDVSDDCGTHLLRLAAINHRNAIVQSLLAHGVDVNATTHDMSPLMWAVSTGTPVLYSSEHLLTVQILIDNGADITAQDEHGWTALTYAAWSGDLAVVRLLLDKGAAINQQDNNGGTALIWAVRKAQSDETMYTDVVKELLARGADTSLKDKDGYTALMYAQKDNAQALARLLTKASPTNPVDKKLP